MGVFKDMGDSLLKYGEIIVNKTEEYSKILKLKLDIKKIESEIEKLEQKVGGHVISIVENGGSVNPGDEVITEHAARCRSCRDTIEAKKNEIEMIRKTAPEARA